ncbi:PucR C-terminal helix-turn-helix domain-containing protein [Clostridium cavendishii DSM 21758]|uniref:PucR C-terminal helix-turn-helix domain-containing protein n=1 Tax=Clostridium cavendishii DSM 21758 TaxID=1121302 RepID=A0A1M6PI94_9CLOT|nr:helix-turn-helix domain-containing protein [Clostridium cavendishii]SHK07620.1 PucR C-terminal helix-turn-helix domain-containing protein [Clostridium cavendishii DSM 21758]
MCSFKDYLQKLSIESGVDFKLMNEDNSVFFNTLDDSIQEDLKEVCVTLGNKKGNLKIKKEFELCASLLKYSIESKYNESFLKREQFIIDILDGNGTNAQVALGAIPFLNKECSLFLISLDKSRNEALGLIKQYYDDDKILSFIYKDYILVIGNVEDPAEHALSIKEVLESNLYCKCVLSYNTFFADEAEIKRNFNDIATCIQVSKKYGLKESVYKSESLLFEKIVYNINENVKAELYLKFKKKFQKFDSEAVLTVEEFVACGLNISEAAKKLYIHRNTLIYRLDKIEKDTGYDIRNFKQATIFIMAFLVWKEKRVDEN